MDKLKLTPRTLSVPHSVSQSACVIIILMIIKTEIIYKSTLDAKLEGLVDETKWFN
jgi:hypothetical protein